jgi:hypothetical protein
MSRSPFVPLEIHLSDGARIVVEHPYDIGVAPHSADFVVYEEQWERVIACRNVTQIITASINSA